MQDGPDAAPDDVPDAPNAPDLPDAAPDAVQDLLNGVFGAISDGEKRVGDVVSGLAEKIGDAIGGSGGDEAAEEAFAFALDVGVDAIYAVAGAL